MFYCDSVPLDPFAYFRFRVIGFHQERKGRSSFQSSFAVGGGPHAVRDYLG